MEKTTTQNAAEMADTPSVRHAKRAGLIPGVPLKYQFGISKTHTTERPPSPDGSMDSAQPVPPPAPSSETPAEEGERTAAPSVDRLSERQLRKLKRKEKKLRRKKRLEATLIGKVARTEKAKLQCRFCLLWFEQRSLIMHLSQCKGSARSRRVKCTVCSVSFPALEVYEHFEACERRRALQFSQAASASTKKRLIRPADGLERAEAASKSLPAGEFHDAAHTVPFEILPPGPREIEVLIARLRRRSRNHRHSQIEKQYYWERFDYLLSLGPVDHWEGKMAWRGYIAFVFPRTDTVILECARKGNATYLLNGRWQEMISATKAELRSEYQHESRRIFHTAGWESSIQQVVSGRWRFSPYR